MQRVAALVMVMATAAWSAQPRDSTSHAEFSAFEAAIDQKLPAPPEVVRGPDGAFRTDALDVELPDGRRLPVFVQLPPAFEASERWPLLLAMHGGPTRDPASSLRGALRMLEVWTAPAAAFGWMVASPAMTHVVARGPRTEDRLPYEILRADQIEAILRAVAARYPVDPDRIVSTGISLGSNFSIAFAAARPDRLAAIVPVSTEGESREHLVRNLKTVPSFILEGALDPNIRDIRGPRALARILEALGYDHVYRELPNRAHEGFEEHYPEVLEWLSQRPRNPYPLDVVRVPHDGIMPLARRVHWIESDTRRGLIHARITSRRRIDVDARWARAVRVYLHDRLVDLDGPIEIWVNGERMHRGSVGRSITFAREDARVTADPGRLYAGSVLVEVPASEAAGRRARALSKSMRPRHREGPLSFWETYALRSRADRMPPLGIEGALVSEDPHRELAGYRIDSVSAASPFMAAGLRRGDVLLEVDEEPFFEGDGVAALRAWLMRELDERPHTITLLVRRDGRELRLQASLSLEGF